MPTMKLRTIWVLLASCLVSVSCNYSNRMNGNTCTSNCGLSFDFPNGWSVRQDDGAYYLAEKTSRRRAERSGSKIDVLFLGDFMGRARDGVLKLPDRAKMDGFTVTSKGEKTLAGKKGAYLVGEQGTLRKYLVEAPFGDCYVRFTLISEAQFFDADRVEFEGLLGSVR